MGGVGFAVILWAQIPSWEVRVSPRNLQDGVLFGDSLIVVGEVTASAGGGGYGGNNVALLRFLPDGTVLWDTAYGTPYDDGATAVDRAGDTLIVAGYLRSADNTVNYEVFLGLFSATNGASHAIRQWGIAGYDIATDVAVLGSFLGLTWLSPDAGGLLDGCVGLFRRDTSLSPVWHRCVSGQDTLGNPVHDRLYALAWAAAARGLAVGRTEEDGPQGLWIVVDTTGNVIDTSRVRVLCQSACGASPPFTPTGPVELRAAASVGDTFLVAGNFVDTLLSPPYQGVMLMVVDTQGVLQRVWLWRVDTASSFAGDTLEVRGLAVQGDTAVLLGFVTTSTQGEDAWMAAVNWRDGTVYWSLSWGSPLSTARDRFYSGGAGGGAVWGVGTSRDSMYVLRVRLADGGACTPGTPVPLQVIPFLERSTAFTPFRGSLRTLGWTARDESSPRTAWAPSPSLACLALPANESRTSPGVPSRRQAFRCRWIRPDGRCVSRPLRRGVYFHAPPPGLRRDSALRKVWIP